mmetsp:Transcript_24886/g.39978  ORF Transcript_24886/g.39978 Transcript_24886/m.39978 type:complete len:322 (+) Transcript_24886:126-1091(+)
MLLASRWIIPALKTPLTSVLLESSMDLTINASSKEGHSIKRKLMRLEIRTTAICKGLLRLAEGGPSLRMPRQLQNFISQFLVRDGIYFPLDWLFNHEIENLETDSDGAIQYMNQDRKRMLIIGFFIYRVVVSFIQMPWKLGIGRQVQGGMRVKNLKTIATIIYRIANIALSYYFEDLPEHEEYISEMVFPTSSPVHKLDHPFLKTNALRLNKFADILIDRYGTKEAIRATELKLSKMEAEGVGKRDNNNSNKSLDKRLDKGLAQSAKWFGGLGQQDDDEDDIAENNDKDQSEDNDSKMSRRFNLSEALSRAKKLSDKKSEH